MVRSSKIIKSWAEDNIEHFKKKMMIEFTKNTNNLYNGSISHHPKPACPPLSCKWWRQYDAGEMVFIVFSFQLLLLFGHFLIHFLCPLFRILFTWVLIHLSEKKKKKIFQFYYNVFLALSSITVVIIWYCDIRSKDI